MSQSFPLIADVSAAKFDEALQLEGISVEPDPVADEAAAMIKALTEATEAATDPIFDDAAAVIRKLLHEAESHIGTRH